MAILGINTAMQVSTVVLADESGVLQTRQISSTREQNRVLLTHVEELVDFDKLEAIIVNVGPGNFTGLRIGLSVAQGLAFARGLPLVGVSNMLLLAHAAWVQTSVSKVAVALDARRDECFVSHADFDGSAALPQEMSVHAVPAKSLDSPFDEDCVFVGDGWLLGSAFKPVEIEQATLANSLIELGRHRLASASAEDFDPRSISPQYVRGAEMWETSKSC